MRTAAEGARRLREALRQQGGELAALSNGGVKVSEPPPDDAGGPAQHAASGPRAAGREADYELLLEMILEGSHLHYGPQRIVHTDDQDLALLLGDQLYALGLARLAGLGDLDAVAELADLISLVAQAHAAADRRLADAVWAAGATAIGWGLGTGYLEAKDLARVGDPRAAEALRGAAVEGAAS